MTDFSFGATLKDRFIPIACPICNETLCRCYPGMPQLTADSPKSNEPKRLYKTEVARIEPICWHHNKPSVFSIFLTTDKPIVVDYDNMVIEELKCAECGFPVARVEYDPTSGIHFKTSTGQNNEIITYAVKCPRYKKHPHSAYITVCYKEED